MTNNEAELRAVVHEHILQFKDRCNSRGDYGTWQDWEDLIVQLISDHTRKARIDELTQLYDEAESPEPYDTCEVVHDHRIAQRIQELHAALKQPTVEKEN